MHLLYHLFHFFPLLQSFQPRFVCIDLNTCMTGFFFQRLFLELNWRLHSGLTVGSLFGGMLTFAVVRSEKKTNFLPGSKKESIFRRSGVVSDNYMVYDGDLHSWPVLPFRYCLLYTYM